MARKEKAGPIVAMGAGPRNFDLAINSEHIRLDALRAQYLAEIFALPAHTAVTIAELAFGEASR